MRQFYIALLVGGQSFSSASSGYFNKGKLLDAVGNLVPGELVCVQETRGGALGETLIAFGAQLYQDVDEVMRYCCRRNV